MNSTGCRPFDTRMRGPVFALGPRVTFTNCSAHPRLRSCVESRVDDQHGRVGPTRMQRKRRAERQLIDATPAANRARARDGAVRRVEQPRQTLSSGTRGHRADVLRAVGPILAAAAPDDLVEIIARANASLPDTDLRKIRGVEVAMLRRLAGQARAFSANLIQHAAERRALGDARGPVSPESANTAAWAGRLADALEPLIRCGSDASRINR
jgi:hypothetical protein